MYFGFLNVFGKTKEGCHKGDNSAVEQLILRANFKG